MWFTLERKRAMCVTLANARGAAGVVLSDTSTGADSAASGAEESAEGSRSGVAAEASRCERNALLDLPR